MRFCAFLFGIVFIALGIAGFEASDKGLFGVFRVNGWLNALHIVSGAAGLMAGFLKIGGLRLYFQAFGVIYALFAILGFVYGGQNILGIFANNPPDTWLHVIAATTALILGYGSQE